MHLAVCHKQATAWGHTFHIFSGRCVAQQGLEIYDDACGHICVLTFSDYHDLYDEYLKTIKLLPETIKQMKKELR